MSPKYDTGAKPPRRKRRLTYLTGKSGPDIGGKAKKLSEVQPYIEAAEQKRLAAAAHAKRLAGLTPMVSHFQNRWSHISEGAPRRVDPLEIKDPLKGVKSGGCGDSFMMVTNGGAHGSSRPNPLFRQCRVFAMQQMVVH